MADHFQLRLVDSRMLAPAVRHLVFERVDGQPLAFQPGQFLQVHFHYDDGTATKRSYSVATIGDGHSPVRRIEIAVSYVEGGAATKLLGELPPGGVIDASGPYGRFCLQETDSHPRYLLLATGTGVTPYRAMLPQIEKLLAKGGREVVLLYGARSEAELLYGEEFEAFAQAHPGFAFHGCLSREARAVPRPGDRLGHVQHALAELGPRADRDIAYLCGNPNMVDAAFNALKEFGLPVPQIRREKYISSR
ncbi:ferredoxin--NADP(+) reductase [Rhodanobacter sp. FW510-R12]|uniref:FAD-binding oxidoreductase n=1 Tax=unclassified Rhodanobacter TaxID=2621553 RepID=UPI0007A9FC0C|nr:MULTISPECIES: FAD-binding oxidoreductase [unclassified Rhodanobacter]KZC18077.1 ferredoxin--NADP(+) reductase [Rhodanobacter sp. FW104-R8]KZC28209.1 ferredoxin--NADP(+) reductase [Rhodanobacter sp. FW510-T8]KZC33427.1 ferredoxin--NADP(+) reductase [Rhodanobacter sp. FW510-R10]